MYFLKPLLACSFKPHDQHGLCIRCSNQSPSISKADTRAVNGLALAIIASDETAVESLAKKKERNPKLDETAIVIKANSKWLESAEASINAE